MTHRDRLGLFMFLLFVMTSGTWAAPPLFVVSPKGNDAWQGHLLEPNADSTDGPFATIARAQRAVRESGGGTGLQQGASVYVRGGVYCLPEPLRFGKEDSGVANAPVVWQAYNGEKVRFVGGVLVGGFAPFRDAIVQCPLEIAAPPGQLFFNGERQTLARWPNKAADGLPGGEWAFVKARAATEPEQSFIYAGDRPAQWSSTEGLDISIWPNYNWWQTITPVAGLDSATHTLRLAQKLPYTIEPGRRYFLQNILAELDTPGEWYYSAAEKRLYFWPPSDVAQGETIVPILENAVVLEGAMHLNFIGFRIEGTRGDGIVSRDSRECLIAKSTVTNTGGYGIAVRGGNAVRVIGNDIFGTGQGGIILIGGDRKTLAIGGHEAVNNHVHHFGALFQTYMTGVDVQGVGNKVAHNLIHDAPHIGILLTGNDHLIEYNEIHHVCLQGADNGGFYMGRDWTQRGNVLRYNKFHDIYGFGLSGAGADANGVYHYESPHQAWGVYLDDCSSGTTIEGNIFYRVPLCGVMIGGGRDNRVTNNVFVDCIPALHIDARWDAYCWDVMNERLQAMNYTQPPYSERYPDLLKMGPDPRCPANNRFEKNIITYTADDFRGLSTVKPGSNTAVVYDFDAFDPLTTVIGENVIFHPEQEVRVAWRAYKDAPGATTLTWAEWQEKGFDKKSRLADPKFFDAPNDDYRLRRESPALELGFKPIPADQIGLYHDEFRASAPPALDTRREGMAYKDYPIPAP